MVGRGCQCGDPLACYELDMSFEIFLQCYRNGEPATFKRTILEEAFGLRDTSRNRRPWFFKVDYPDGGGADVYPDDGDDQQGIMFSRCGGDTFFDALYRLAEVTKSVIFWPYQSPAVAVTNETTVAHLPSCFLDEGIGPAHVVHSGRELRDYVFRKRDRK